MLGFISNEDKIKLIQKKMQTLLILADQLEDSPISLRKG